LPQSNPFKLIQSAQIGTADHPTVWEWSPAFGRFVWRIEFEIDQKGGYALSASATDLGGFNAHDGKWIASSYLMNTQSGGGYFFVEGKSLVMTGTIRGALTTTRNGRTLWERSTTEVQLSAPIAVSSVASSQTTPSPAASPTPAVAAVASTPEAAPTLNPINRRFLVTHSSPVYASPDSTTATVAHIHRGRHVHVTGLTGDWLQVEMNGTVGFIPDQTVE
jgi:Bacterial SH3 domain